jgi:hypothetical protein
MTELNKPSAEPKSKLKEWIGKKKVAALYPLRVNLLFKVTSITLNFSGKELPLAELP